MKLPDFEAHFNEYREYLHEEVRRFQCFVTVLRQIEDRTRDSLDVINLSPAFFQITQSALFSGVILWGHKLLDVNGERGFHNFLAFIEQNRKWLSTQQLQIRRAYPDNHWMLRSRTSPTLSTVRADKTELSSLQVLPSLKTRRDKFYGHFDKGYFFDRTRLDKEAPLDWLAVDAALHTMEQVFNRYSAQFDGKTFSIKPVNIGDLDSLLARAKRSRLRK